MKSSFFTVMTFRSACISCNSHQQEQEEAESDEQERQDPMTAGPCVGRNEFCPCGSGKKYKKCCYQAETV